MKRASRISRRTFTAIAAQGALGAIALGSPRASSAPPLSPPDDATSPRGIWKTIRRPRALLAPLDAPKGETWRYMLDYPFQIAPDLAGAYLNIKACDFHGQDFECGTDIVPFDRADRLDPAQAVKVARLEVAPNPNNGGKPAYLNKYPGTIGFVPYGAARADGSPHPHAGTGFILVSAVARPMDTSEGVTSIGIGTYRGAKRYARLELHQLSYDGKRLQVSPPEIISGPDLIPGTGHDFDNGGMGCAIPDGDELITGASARKTGGDMTSGGILHWRRVAGSWRPTGFEPVSPYDNSLEPTVVRDIDGSLLIHVRARPELGPPIRLWRRDADGGPWEQKINLHRMTPSAPITLNRAVDGSPFIACNLYQPLLHPSARLDAFGDTYKIEPGGPRGKRSTICLLLLNEARDGFDAQFVARDPLVEFGVPPHHTLWAADHPTASVVRLADNALHCLMGYRILEWAENTQFVAPSPQTGSYLDEIVSFGKPSPIWNF